jgi:hypothetical protein
MPQLKATTAMTQKDLANSDADRKRTILNCKIVTYQAIGGETGFLSVIRSGTIIYPFFAETGIASRRKARDFQLITAAEYMRDDFPDDLRDALDKAIARKKARK